MKIDKKEFEIAKKLNKYNLDMKQIRALKVGNRELIKTPLFWRNNVISAWCASGSVGNSKFCDETEYWLGIYDEDAKAYKGKVRFSFSTYGGMCGYNFNTFFNPKTIETMDDLRIQKLFLEKINNLIDMGVLVRGVQDAGIY